MARDISILIVEDNDEIADIITAYLKHDGYITIHAKNGENALKLVTRCPPELVILDVNMPGMSGIATLHKLKSMTTAIVIMLTANADPHLRQQAFRAGADAYMMKPFAPAELLMQIKSTLEKTSAKIKNDALLF